MPVSELIGMIVTGAVFSAVLWWALAAANGLP
jgi:hypothetical protein